MPNIFEQALARVRNEKLAHLLVSVVEQFHTPTNDPLYDWTITKLNALGVETYTADGSHWKVDVPEEVTCRAWSAPASQCAIAYGTRWSPSAPEPSKVAVLVRAVQENGQIKAQIGAYFFRRQDGTWFPSRISGLDATTASLITRYLNRTNTSVNPNADGVDLD